MTKSNKILCIFGAILIAFVGLFGIIFATQNDSVVKADTSLTVTSFTGSNFLVPVAPFVKSSNVTPSYLDTPLSNSAMYISFDLGYRVVNNASELGSFFGVHVTRYDLNVTNTYGYHSIIYDAWDTYWFMFLSGSSSYHWFAFNYYVDSGFNNNIVSCAIHFRDSGVWGMSNRAGVGYIYTDTDGHVFSIYPVCSSYPSGYSSYNDRTYLFVSDLTSNQYYQAGLQEGLNREQPNIYNEGYQKAIDDNKSNWEQTGYNRGIADSNRYSFINLIGAAFDVPLNAFKSAFDFNLLGINLKNFFFAIISFGIIIFVARLLLH